MRKITSLFKTLFVGAACMFCMQTALAADNWKYPTKSSKPDGNFGGGSGTEANPYLIKNAQQLADLAWCVNDGNAYKGKYFKLTADITLNDITWTADNTPSSMDGLKAWTPIGEYGFFTNDAFEGIFDGGGHTVSGLVVKVSDYEYGGMFGAMKRAVVRNLTISDSYLYEPDDIDDNRAGLLAGYMSESQIYDCHVVKSCVNVYSDDNSTSAIGGVVGQGSGEGKSMTSCSFDGHIRLCHGKGKTYVAGLMALGAPELKCCEVSGDMDILANGDSRANSFVCANGLCYEAGTVTESVSRMNFNIGHTDKRRTTCPDISVNGFCYKTVRIYEGAYMGKVNVQSTDDWNVGEIGSLHQDEGAIRNGVFYCKVSGPAEPSTRGEFTFYPIGAEVIDIPSTLFRHSLRQYWCSTTTVTLTRPTSTASKRLNL